MNEIELSTRKVKELYQEYDRFDVYNVFLIKNEGTKDETKQFIYRETVNKRKITREPSLTELLINLLQE